MSAAASIAGAVGRLVLLPGDLACNVTGVGSAGYRDLLRMLVNSLVWAAVGGVVVVLSV